MQGTEKSRLYSSTRLCAGACCAPFMDGYLITSVGLVWFLSDFVCAGNSPWLVGFSAFAYILGSFFGALFGGWIGDRIGRRVLYTGLAVLPCRALRAADGVHGSCFFNYRSIPSGFCDRSGFSLRTGDGCREFSETSSCQDTDMADECLVYRRDFICLYRMVN